MKRASQVENELTAHYIYRQCWLDGHTIYISHLNHFLLLRFQSALRPSLSETVILKSTLQSRFLFSSLLFSSCSLSPFTMSQPPAQGPSFTTPEQTSSRAARADVQEQLLRNKNSRNELTRKLLDSTLEKDSIRRVKLRIAHVEEEKEALKRL